MRKIKPLVILACVALFVFVVNMGVRGPMIQSDEGSYLANAAAMAGFPNDMENAFRAGYSIIIAPAFWLAKTPQGVWLAVKIINAFLFALTVAGLWLTARQLSPASDSRSRALAVGLVSLYPMWLVMAGYSFAQIAFIPVFVFTFLAYLHSISGGAGAWISLGILSGFLYWIHPTAVAPIFAALAGAAYVTVRRRSFGLFASLSLGVVSMILMYQLGVVPWLQMQMSTSGLPPISLSSGLTGILAPLISVHEFKQVIAHLAGQFFYLSIGTVGFLWLGLFALMRRSPDAALSGLSSPLQKPSIGIFLGFSLLGMMGISSLLYSYIPAAELNHDQWIYGRYAEAVIAPLLLLGALATSSRKLLWVIPIAALSALLLWLVSADYSQVAPFNIPAFWQDSWQLEPGLWTLLFAACGLLVLIAFLPRKIGMLLVGVIFICTSYLQIDWHKTASEGAMRRWNAASTIREQFPPGTCVGFDHSGIDSYKKRVFWSDFGFALFDYQMKRMTPEQWNESCDGPLLSYQDDFGVEGTRVYPLALSYLGGPNAWARGLPPAGLAPISWDGETRIPSQVGYHTGSGMQSDGRAGFLIYGPYEPIMAGNYEFQITGLVESNGNEIEVDVSDIRSGKTFARFKGLGNHRGSTDSRLLKSQIVLRDDVAELEVRLHVEEGVDVYIDGYSLKLIAPDEDANELTDETAQ